ncbi:hypothetical protein [Rhodococcus opacus]|uniref:hypothetical protein n=1 Tax=Rhodococcus opacus TaxID=37919 RepID=UPI002236BAA9|nr:hypothetical protein [Rhodococcus opacus]UZG60394.1 hypothetical protein ONE62_42830 [Rhodococcus opacus]
MTFLSVQIPPTAARASLHTQAEALNVLLAAMGRIGIWVRRLGPARHGMACLEPGSGLVDVAGDRPAKVTTMIARSQGFGSCQPALIVVIHIVIHADDIGRVGKSLRSALRRAWDTMITGVVSAGETNRLVCAIDATDIGSQASGLLSSRAGWCGSGSYEGGSGGVSVAVQGTEPLAAC